MYTIKEVCIDSRKKMTECVERVMVDLSWWFPVVIFGGLQKMTEFLCEWCSFLSGNVYS
jgi:hypothetical protein